jgi:hypothetical protein
MRSPCCLSAGVSVYIYLMKSSWYVCLCVCISPFNIFFLYTVHAISKKSRRLTLPRTSCNIIVLSTLISSGQVLSWDSLTKITIFSSAHTCYLSLHSRLPSMNIINRLIERYYVLFVVMMCTFICNHKNKKMPCCPRYVISLRLEAGLICLNITLATSVTISFRVVNSVVGHFTHRYSYNEAGARVNCIARPTMCSQGKCEQSFNTRGLLIL